jgi:glycosyltransferase involved in cell wall biosynthesis
MRLVLVSTHIDQTTGYSKVSSNLVKQLATLSPKVKTFHFGFQRHPSHASLRKYPEGITSYDAAANEEPKEEGFGFNKIHEYLEMVQPNIVMIYNDPYTVSRFIDSMKHERGKSSYKLWIYLDQVYCGVAPSLMDSIRKHADRVYCFTDSWKKQFLEYGPFPEVNVLEHAVDPTVFSCLSEDTRHSIRTNIGVAKDAILFLNANRNSNRKRLDLTVGGFVRLLQRNPEKPYFLMIATNMNPQTGAFYDLQRIFLEELKLLKLDFQTYGRRLLLIDTSPPNLLSDEAINQLYNAADIGINTSDGEGYGLCQLEHMYTGAPQLVTDVGSYRAFLNSDIAEFIPSNGRTYFAGGMPHGFWCPTFSMESIADGMESILKQLPEKRKSVSSYQFKSWATVCDSWLEDVLTQAEGPVASVSVPVISAVPT